MRVLHLGKFCPPFEGGIEIFTSDLVESLNKFNIKADLLCFSDVTCESIFKNFKLFKCCTKYKISSAPISIDYLKYFLKIVKNYDILHVHSPNPLAEILTLFTSKKVVIHWHSDIVRQKILYLFYRPIQQRVLERASKIIVTSPQYLESSEQIKPYHRKSIVIPLGLNPNRLEEEIRDSADTSFNQSFSNKRVVLSIGRLVYYKGFEYLIEAVKYLDEDTVVVIAGGGPLYRKLIKKIKTHSFENRVFLLGRVDRVAPLIKNCHLFCLPSITRTEAFGLVLLEALYFGRPLVTTDVPGSGMSYVNIHGETGLIVPPKDPRALAEAIKQILNNPDLYKKFSENARRRFEEFTIEKIGDKILNLYREIMF